MSRELWLLRHGKAELGVGMADIDRRLQKSGEQEVLQMGLCLQQQGLIPDIIITSPAVRAYATARMVADTLAMPDVQWRQDARLYFHGLEVLKQVLAEVPQVARCVLLVGHNPDFEQLANDLAGVAHVRLATASVARLAMPDDWQALPAGCARLEGVWSPSE